MCNDLKWHYYDVMKVWLYICTTKREYEYCKEKFGYKDENMALTGLCRFDNLYDENVENIEPVINIVEGISEEKL